MVLTRDRGAVDAYRHVDGRDVEEPKDLTLTWDQRIASWSIAGGAGEYRLSQLRLAILRILEEAGQPLQPKEVAELLEVCSIHKSNNAVKQRMYQMSLAGLLKNQDGKNASRNRNHRNLGNRRDSDDPNQRAEVA